MRHGGKAGTSAVIAAAVLAGLPATGAADRPRPAGPTAASADRPAAGVSASRRAARRARERRRLARRVRRDPRAVLRRGFLRRAAFVDFALPVTARLRPATDDAGGRAAADDLLEFAFTEESSPVPWPDLDGAGPLEYAPPAAPVTSTLEGRFTTEWDFGADASGYGALGALEARLGAGVEVAGSAFDVSDFAPSCPSGPALRAVSRRVAGPADAPGVGIATGGTRIGVIDLLNGRIRGSLLLRLRFRSEVAAACGAPPATTKLVEPTGGDGVAAIPVWFDGRLRISPAITADGKLRLARMEVDGVASPQRTTFGYVAACTQAHGPLDDATCVPGDGDAALFPARVSFRRLTADLIIGDVPA